MNGEEAETIQNEKGLEFAWTEGEVVHPQIEPSISQIMEENRSVVVHWMADLTKNKDYKPTAETMKAIVLRAVSDWTISSDLNSSPEYFDYVQNISAKGPSAWREAASSNNTVDSLNESLGRTNAASKLKPEDYGLVEMETSSKQEAIVGKYFQSFAERKESLGYDSEKIVTREEKHPVFVHGLDDIDDSNAMLQLAHELSERLSGTEDGARAAIWMMDNIDRLASRADYDEFTALFYRMTELAGKPNEYNSEFYDKLSRFLASEEVIEKEFNDPDSDSQYIEKVSVFKNSETGSVEMDEYSRWDAMRTIFGFGDGRREVLDGLILATSGMESIEERNKVLATIFGEKGPAEVLSYMRLVINDESFSDHDRVNAARLYRSFYENVVQTADESVVPKDIEAFYSLVVNNESFMTEKEEGNRRVELLTQIFEKEGLTDELVIDTACGTGWLTDRLKEKGYNVIGVDLNKDLIAKAKERFPNNEYFVASWDDLSHVPSIDKAKVFMVNGRSIHHLSQFGGFHGMMTQMENADMIVFDALNPETGAQQVRLENFRKSLQNFGFSEEWLNQYMWQGVGSHDGVTLGDRWYPPEEWWTNMLGLYGFDTEVVVEPNYNGQGVDNLVFVAKKIADENIREERKNIASDYFRKLMDGQPQNNNRYRINNYLPFKRAKRSN